MKSPPSWSEAKVSVLPEPMVLVITPAPGKLELSQTEFSFTGDFPWRNSVRGLRRMDFASAEAYEVYKTQVEF